MHVETSRFGTVTIAEDDIIRFPSGIIGFPDERAFFLIPHGKSSVIAWLQSAASPALAFPVVSAHGLPQEYPDVPIAEAASRAGVGEVADELAVLAVLAAPMGLPATVNLLAPLIVNAATRIGAQVFLDGSRFSTQEIFVLPAAPRAPEASAATVSAP